MNAVGKEQFLNTLPTDKKLWVLERKPETCVQAGELADEYEQARRPETETLASSTPKPNRVSSRECQYCGKSGHAEEDCYKRKREESQRGRGAYYKAVHTKEVWEPGGTYKGSLGTRGCILRKSGNQGVHTKEVWEHTKEVCEPGGAY